MLRCIHHLAALLTTRPPHLSRCARADVAVIPSTFKVGGIARFEISVTSQCDFHLWMLSEGGEGEEDGEGAEGGEGGEEEERADGEGGDANGKGNETSEAPHNTVGSSSSQGSMLSLEESTCKPDAVLDTTWHGAIPKREVRGHAEEQDNVRASEADGAARDLKI